MSKFSTKRSAKHYCYLKGIVKYLCLTKYWVIKFKRTTKHSELDDSKFQTSVVLASNLPEFIVYINMQELLAFVDASYTNNTHKQRSTTKFVFTYYCGAIFYRSKTQRITALSSTEAEFLAAVLCAKITCKFCSILKELWFCCTEATKTQYEDNASTIMIVNSQVKTESACHIYVSSTLLFTIGENEATSN